ncbi:MAG: hemolysin III family protein [Erysipelotrichaceae bacterium]
MRENGLRNIYEVSPSEEAANAITHVVMSLACLVAIAPSAISAYLKGGPLQAAAVTVFILCLFAMFTGSAFYHLMPFHTTYKFVSRLFDHIFIYFAIAGTYTPIALCLIKGWQGTLIFIIQWSMVIIGIFYKLFSKKSIPWLSVGIYLVMGWSAIMFMPILLQRASTIFLSLIVLGGVLYSIGVYFYSQKKKKYFHSIWHICINLASIAHFIAIIFYM